jgi:hypothetical protein
MQIGIPHTGGSSVALLTDGEVAMKLLAIIESKKLGEALSILQTKTAGT